MSNSQKQELINQLLGNGDSIQQGSAAYDLAKSGDTDLVTTMLLNLERLDDGARGNAMDMAVDGLLETAPNSLKPLLSCLQNSSKSVAGKCSAYMLGEVAYRQGVARDPAIVPALLQALTKSLALGVCEAASCIHALRECARTGPIPEANSAMNSVLADADRPQPQFNSWYLTLALEVLAINHSNSLQDFSIELSNQLQLLPPDSKAFKELQAGILEAPDSL